MTTSADKAAAKRIDLSTLLVQDTARIELKHPLTKAGLGMFVLIAGRDSATFQSAQRDRLTKRMERAKLTGEASPTMDELRDEDLELLTRCTLGFEEMVLDGEELSADPDTVRSVLRRFPWIYEQIDTEVANRGNFIRG